MERTHLFDAALAQKLVDSIAAELNQNVNITDHKGLIIASFDKKRIGTTHEITAKKLAAGEYREFSISEEEALIYPGVRRGVNVPIIYDHVCYGVVGVTGEPSQASPPAQPSGLDGYGLPGSDQEFPSPPLHRGQRRQPGRLRRILPLQQEGGHLPPPHAGKRRRNRSCHRRQPLPRKPGFH